MLALIRARESGEGVAPRILWRAIRFGGSAPGEIRTPDLRFRGATTTHAVGLFAGETDAKSGEIRTHVKPQDEEKYLQILLVQMRGRTNENRGVPGSSPGLATSDGASGEAVPAQSQAAGSADSLEPSCIGYMNGCTRVRCQGDDRAAA
jgi:hypothetical protein